MKSNAQPSFYFSAYPLKAVSRDNSANDQSPYLKAILSAKTNTASRVRVFAMINPYKEINARVMPVAGKLVSEETDWFNNYE
jgi:hypothetical protein